MEAKEATENRRVSRERVRERERFVQGKDRKMEGGEHRAERMKRGMRELREARWRFDLRTETGDAKRNERWS